MLDIEGNRVFDEANGLYRIAVLGVGAIYIDTRLEVVRLGPLWLEVDHLFKVPRSLGAGLHGPKMPPSTQIQERFIWMKFDRARVIRNGGIALILGMLGFGATKVRIPVVGISLD